MKKIFPEFKDIYINDYIKEINNSIKNGNYLSALALSLMIPDICRDLSGSSKGKRQYINWFNKYVYPYYETIYNNDEELYFKTIDFNGACCYALRNAILHTGSTKIEYDKGNENLHKEAKIDAIELCLNSCSDEYHQYGDGSSIIIRSDNSEFITIRINIIEFANNMKKGYKKYISENENLASKKMFKIIDFDLLDEDLKNSVRRELEKIIDEDKD